MIAPDYSHQVAIVPAVLCYPGAVLGEQTSYRLCALVAYTIMRLLTSTRLTILVGLHAQKLYLCEPDSLTNTVRRHPMDSPLLPLSHPS